METALTGGDDYELLFTAPPSAADDLEALSQELNLALTRIGRIDGGGNGDGKVRVIGNDGQEIKIAKPGYRHF